MSKLKRLLLTLFIVGFGTSLFSQKTIIKGKVFDNDTKESLPFVNVSFKNSKTGTTTDLDGNFSLETYYATDSLSASFVGYKLMSLKVEKDESQTLNFAMQSGAQELSEVVVIADKKYVDPAVSLMEKVVANKKINDRKKLDAYEYEVYNKVEFDLNNIDEDFKNRKAWKPFKFIFDYLDTTDSSPYLPILMTESMSNYYFTRIPKRKKEIIKATKISGLENESLQQFLGDMYQNINIYDNYIMIFNKSFVSPVANLGPISYHYYLLDSMDIDNHKCYKIKYIPRREYELNFSGHLWISDTTYAVKRVEATISKNANINFVRELKIEQDYNQVEREVWMLTKDFLLVDFNLAEKTIGFYGRKTSTYKGFVVNKPRDNEFYADGTNISVADDADKKTDVYWDSTRHEELSENEIAVYHMVDTLKSVPAFKTYVDVIKIVTTGFKEFEKIELGPYFNVYSYNPVEGHRFKMGVRTLSEFTEQIRLRGYLAYGTRDKQFKYGLGTDIFLNRKTWTMLHLDYRNDIMQMGTSENNDQQDNILASFFRARPANQLNGIEQFKVGFEHWYSEALSNELIFDHRELRSVTPSLTFDIDPDTTGVNALNRLKISEIKINTHFALREKYVLGAFDRYSLSSMYPIINLRATFGIKGAFGSQYEYQKIYLSIQDKIFINPLGYSVYHAGYGKVWGQVPFPVLELHNGNETFFYDPLAFNLMNFLEYASDEYIQGIITHHFNGLFLNKIPLMRRLHWRELVWLKGVAGSLRPENQNVMEFPNSLSALPKPYFESGMGIENIFKVLRIDFMYRLTNLNKDKSQSAARNFGASLSLQFTF